MGEGENIIELLLKNRGIKDKDNFLNPPPPKSPLKIPVKAIKRVELAVKNQEPVIVYGDYDVDGICATAIVWETLNKMGAKVLPFIPRRENEGYGLSIAGIDNIDTQTKLIITVDSGIVAHEAVAYAKKKGIDVIILDHHEKPKALPKAYAIIHTDKLCAAGIAYFFSCVIASEARQSLLELAAIATVCDMMPLTGVNRSIVKHGLKSLNETNRPGLKALYDVAGIKTVGVYEIGYMIGPRLNAAGRIDSALTALRLLCTKDIAKAQEWARQLNDINKERQAMVEESVTHAHQAVSSQQLAVREKIIVIEHESYHPGIIGLIAGKLTEKYYLPSIVISKKDGVSRASARSISGFNIIEAIRTTEKLLINAGGHPAAAGFTIETTNISDFKLQIIEYAKLKLTDNLLEKTLRVDCKIDIKNVNHSLFTALCTLEPYGMGNPQPVFCSEVTVLNTRTMGAIGQHIKLTLENGLEAVGFNMSHFAAKLKAGQKVSLAYTLDLNFYNGKTTLQLKIKDIIFH